MIGIIHGPGEDGDFVAGGKRLRDHQPHMRTGKLSGRGLDQGQGGVRRQAPFAAVALAGVDEKADVARDDGVRGDLRSLNEELVVIRARDWVERADGDGLSVQERLVGEARLGLHSIRNGVVVVRLVGDAVDGDLRGSIGSRDADQAESEQCTDVLLMEHSG